LQVLILTDLQCWLRGVGAHPAAELGHPNTPYFRLHACASRLRSRTATIPPRRHDTYNNTRPELQQIPLRLHTCIAPLEIYALYCTPSERHASTSVNPQCAPSERCTSTSTNPQHVLQSYEP